MYSFWQEKTEHNPEKMKSKGKAEPIQVDGVIRDRRLHLLTADIGPQNDPNGGRHR